uniref:Uncharacterized protein n=1 Tax=Human betaherpesvirus 6 TaxID=10368 RepID=A0A5P9U3K3_9BETA|nr:hypothetical protein [Human betaherpesvirus 6]
MFLIGSKSSILMIIAWNIMKDFWTAVDIRP